LTTNDTDGKDIEQYLQDFYDANAPGYDRPHGNAAILALDVDVREVYVAGFYHAEKYLDNDRIDSLLDQITPDLSDEQYYEAFNHLLPFRIDIWVLNRELTLNLSFLNGGFNSLFQSESVH